MSVNGGCQSRREAGQVSHLTREFILLNPPPPKFLEHQRNGLPFSTFSSVLCHIPDPTMCVSNFPRFSFTLPYSRSYNVHFSFSFLDIFHVLQCVFLIFHVFLFPLPYESGLYRVHSADCWSWSMFPIRSTRTS